MANLSDSTTFGDHLITGNLTVDGTLTANSPIEGNAETASKWETARTITLTGAVTGSVAIDGSNDVILTTTESSIANDYLSSTSNDTATGVITFSASPVISNTSPSLKLNDTTSGSDDFWVQADSNNFLITTDRDNNGSAETPHPLVLDNATSTLQVYGNTVGTNSYRDLTISTDEPTGGNDGDVWYQYE